MSLEHVLSHRAGLWQPLPDDIRDAFLDMPRCLRCFVFCFAESVCLAAGSLFACLSLCVCYFFRVIVCLFVRVFVRFCMCACPVCGVGGGVEALAFYG